jgi:hypothetical protein
VGGKPTALRICIKCRKQKANSDFYENYVDNAVTAEDVLNAANKYLIDNTRIIIAGKLGCYSGLENLIYLILFPTNLAIKPILK